MSEGFAGEGVHLMVYEPHGDFGDSCGPFFDFDAVHLVYIDFEEVVEIEKWLDLAAFDGVVFFEYFYFEESEFSVGDDEEVAAAAGGVEEFE